MLAQSSLPPASLTHSCCCCLSLSSLQPATFDPEFQAEAKRIGNVAVSLCVFVSVF